MGVLTPLSITMPPPATDIIMVRGDVYQIVMGFTGVEDVVAMPSAYRLRLSFRQRLSDALPILFSTDATLEIEPDETLNGLPMEIIATFNMTDLETASLPPTGAVYWIEWTNSIGGSPSRILQGSVGMVD